MEEIITVVLVYVVAVLSATALTTVLPTIAGSMVEYQIDQQNQTLRQVLENE